MGAPCARRPNLERIDVHVERRRHAVVPQGAAEALTRPARSPHGERPPCAAEARRQIAPLERVEAGEGVARIGHRRAPRVVPPAEEQRRHLGDLPPGGVEAEPEVVVLGPGHVAVAAGGGERLAAHGHRGVTEGRLDEEIAIVILRRDQPVEPGHVAPRPLPHQRRGEGLDQRAHRAQLGACVEQRRRRREAAGHRDVVGVHASQELPAGDLHAARERAGDPQARGRQRHHARVAAGDLGDARRAVVARAVVDGDHLEGEAALGEHAAEGLLDGPARVAVRQQDRDPRRHFLNLRRWVTYQRPCQVMIVCTSIAASSPPALYRSLPWKAR